MTTSGREVATTGVTSVSPGIMSLAGTTMASALRAANATLILCPMDSTESENCRVNRGTFFEEGEIEEHAWPYEWYRCSVDYPNINPVEGELICDSDAKYENYYGYGLIKALGYGVETELPNHNFNNDDICKSFGNTRVD